MSLINGRVLQLNYNGDKTPSELDVLTMFPLWVHSLSPFIHPSVAATNLKLGFMSK